MGELIGLSEDPQSMNAEFASQHIDELYGLVQLIPEVSYTRDDLLAEAKADGRILHAKWQHSYAIAEGDKMVGIVMGYEREPDHTANYPENTLYISELAVDPEYQGRGFGRALLSKFLADALEKGFTKLSGPLSFTVQTNTAAWNEPVRSLYESFGFEAIGQKDYGNRIDVVMRASPDAIRL